VSPESGTETAGSGASSSALLFVDVVGEVDIVLLKILA